MNSDEQELLEALRDAVRWLDSIHDRLGFEMIQLLPNNCLGRPAMRAIISRMEVHERT